MIDMNVVDLSRLQFALTALYHFLFVPLTLGLSMILVIMEAAYVMTGREVWKQMTQFWGVLFGINFAMGVATGITMEFQFGTNWAYFSHYVGDIFGAPLALEGLMAFFLESTFVGLFFFGWKRLSRRTHLLVTFLVALGSNFSALWILIANGWMQRPGRRAFQLRDDAHGTHLLQRGDLQSGGAGQIRTHRRCRLRDWRGIRARDFSVVSAEQAQPRLCASLDGRRGKLWPRFSRSRSSCSAMSRDMPPPSTRR